MLLIMCMNEKEEELGIEDEGNLEKVEEKNQECEEHESGCVGSGRVNY